MVTISIELPLETGELVEKALDRARDTTPSRTTEVVDEPWSAQQADAIVIVEDEQGEPLSVGRKTRTVPTAIKRALRARDKGCTFPGCHNTRFVDAHHIKHWSAGGETSLDNLMLLCSRHHRLVHEGGFRIERDYQDRWFFKRPDGRAVPDCGYHVNETINEFSNVINYPSAEGLLTAVKINAVSAGI